MTKSRPPLSIDAALGRIAGQLRGGYDDMALECGRATRTVRHWSDPDAEESIPIECAIKLDLAFQAAGGTGAPIFETYALQLELAAADRFADSMELARRIPDIIRECGEANAALVEAADPSATASPRQTALLVQDKVLPERTPPKNPEPSVIAGQPP